MVTREIAQNDANGFHFCIVSWPATMWRPAIVMVRAVRPSVRLSVTREYVLN